jgi:exosortase
VHAEPERPNTTLLAAWGVLSLAALTVLYYRTFVALWPRWTHEAAYQHCALVPFIVIGLVWLHRGRLAALRPTASPGALAVLIPGLALCYLGYLTGARFLVGLSFPIVLMGLLALGLGWEYLRVLGFPLALFLFAVPFPRHILGMVAMPMQLVSSTLTAACTRVFGIPVYQEGVNIVLPSFQFVVAEECSGLNSLLALFLTCGVITELRGHQVWQKLAVYALTPLIVIVANVIRLMSVVLLGEIIGEKFALNHLIHGGSDVLVYLSAFLLVWGLCDMLRALSGRETTALSETEECPA